MIQVDAFGVALNPMVESEWMFSRNGCIIIVSVIIIIINSCDYLLEPQHIFWPVLVYLVP